MTSRNIKYLVAGAGLAGLTAAHYLEKDYIIIEKDSSPGGTAGTIKHNGFNLDHSIHILYFRDPEIKSWLENKLSVKLFNRQRKCSVWIKGTYINFPVQYNLNDLPLPSRISASASILCTFFKSNEKTTFLDYSLSSFGKYLTEVFVQPYNEKMFSFPINKMNTRWMGDYVPSYSRFRMLADILPFINNSYGRNSSFFYPTEGGIATVSEAISASLTNLPEFKKCIKYISVKEKRAFLSDGSEILYKYLLNTIPLNHLLGLCTDLPEKIMGLAELLKKNPTTILHLLGKGKINAGDNHWIYVPDPGIPFHRITVPGNIAVSNCPEGHFALSLEFGGDVAGDDKILSRSIDALKKMRILTANPGEVLWKPLDYGYVIYDDKREYALKGIMSFLISNNIHSFGRYGGWEYSNMEDAIIQGKITALELIGEEQI